MRSETLKQDALGTTRRVDGGAVPYVERDTRTAHAALRWLARRLAAREAAALMALAGETRVPSLLAFDGHVVRRSFLPGRPLHAAGPPSRAYFVDALRVLRRMHRAGIAHNDLAKEANWLVTDGGRCAIVDFQLAMRARRRSAQFRRRAYEDLRHLLKHKRTYEPLCMTARQLRVLARPTWETKVWRALVKPPYRFVTRVVLGWPERAGPVERARPASRDGAGVG
jgi:RIO-like serine/threonine protein kinase